MTSCLAKGRLAMMVISISCRSLHTTMFYLQIYLGQTDPGDIFPGSNFSNRLNPDPAQ
jgi:hypothetical protein